MAYGKITVGNMGLSSCHSKVVQRQARGYYSHCRNNSRERVVRGRRKTPTFKKHSWQLS